MMKKDKWIYGLLILLGFIACSFFLPTVSHSDLDYWYHWAIHIYEHGLGDIYNYADKRYIINYHPIWLYLLDLFGWIQGSVENIVANKIYIKALPLFFDFLGAIAIFYIIPFNRVNRFLPLLLLLNIGYLYNSMIWGQLDGIFTFFVIMSLAFALRSQLLWSLLFLILAVNTKLQAIIFLPILGLLYLPLIRKYSWKSCLAGLGVLVAFQTAILLPFILSGTLGKFWNVITGAVDFYSNLSLNAYNLWYLIFSYKAVEMLDPTIAIWGLSYKACGQILFLVFSTIILLPLTIRCFNYFFTKKIVLKNLAEQTFLTTCLIALCFFFFNTQMHERYSHPILLSSFFYAVLRKNYWLFGICSLAYFLNMERVLRAFDLGNYHTFIFSAQFIASLFLLVLILGIISLYRGYQFKSSYQQLLITFKNILK